MIQFVKFNKTILEVLQNLVQGINGVGALSEQTEQSIGVNYCLVVQKYGFSRV